MIVNPKQSPSFEDRQTSADARRYRRLRLLRNLSPVFFGFAFARACNDAFFYYLGSALPLGAWAGQDVLSMAMLVVFIAAILLARKLAPLYLRQGFIWASAALMSVAAFCLWGWQSTGVIELALVAAIAGGLGSALAILLWSELQCCFGSLLIVVYIAGGFFFGSLLGWAIVGLEGPRMAAVLIACALASSLCLRSGFPLIQECDLPRKSWGKVRFPWKLVLVLGVYEFVIGVREVVAPSGDGTMFLLGVLVSALIVFIAAYFSPEKLDFMLIFRAPFALVVCGLLFALLALPLGDAVSGFLSSLGYSMMFTLITVLMCDISHRYGVSVLVLCGIKELSAIGLIAGHSCAAAGVAGVLPLPPDSQTAEVVLTGFVVLASVFLLFGSKDERWGLEFFGVDRLAAEGDAQGVFVLRCNELADMHHLSPREREVFQLLALGKSPVSIEKELCIANGTLKSHTRRIYQKLGIHSREELRTLVGDVPK